MDDESNAVSEERWMRRALELAERGRGLTSPNPMVGAVLVREDGVQAGEGWHRRVGAPHAEVEAIASVGAGDLPRCTLYVTLEPCSTHGRTPPCTDAIVRAGIRHVVVGATDPNPKHAGRGLDMLRRLGIGVHSGVLEKECTWLNRGFNRWIVTGRPWVVVKTAMSLDGRITRPAGESRWLTGQPARRKAHELRSECDAILVGANTVRADNPELTVRLPGWQGRQPWRIVVAGRSGMPGNAKVFSDVHRRRTIIYRNLPMERIFHMAGCRGITSILVEGGAMVAGEVLAKGLADEVAFFHAPILCGENTRPVFARSFPASVRVDILEREVLGTDLFVRGLVCST